MACLFGIPPIYNTGHFACALPEFCSACLQRQEMWSDEGRAIVLQRLVQRLFNDYLERCPSDENVEQRDGLVKDILQTILGAGSDIPCDPRSVHELLQQLFGGCHQNESVQKMMQELLGSNASCGDKSPHDFLQQLLGNTLENESVQKMMQAFLGSGGPCGAHPVHDILKQLFGGNCASSNETTTEQAGPSTSKTSRTEVEKATVELAKMDVKGFDPADVTVKVNGRTLKVSARHEEGSAGGDSYVLKEFQKQIQIPEGVDPDELLCEMNDDGLLKIKMPKKNVAKEINVTVQVPILSDASVDQGAENTEQQRLEESAKDTEGQSQNVEVHKQ